MPVRVIVLPVVALGTSHGGRPVMVQLYPAVPPATAQTVENCVPTATAPVGARQPILSWDAAETLIVMVCEAVSGVGKLLSVTATMRLYEEGGDGGTVPVRMTVAPVFAESVSHDAPPAVHLRPPVPPNAEQVIEYGRLAAPNRRAQSN